MLQYNYNCLNGTVDIYRGDHIQEIKVGDRFYHNNYTTKIKASLPDYLVITKFVPHGWLQNYFYIQAHYENHSIGRKERLFSDVILKASNLDPDVENPDWIFVGKDEKIGS